MGEITAITPQIKDKRRCNVYVDGRFYCGITLETAVKNRLKAGLTIDEKRLDELRARARKAPRSIRHYRHISACAKTEKDVRKFLQSKGYLPTVENYVSEKGVHTVLSTTRRMRKPTRYRRVNAKGGG